MATALALTGATKIADVEAASIKPDFILNDPAISCPGAGNAPSVTNPLNPPSKIGNLGYARYSTSPVQSTHA
ncbi:MAG: hypothetical protein U0559_09700 [Anaerolineae bacterium]